MLSEDEEKLLYRLLKEEDDSRRTLESLYRVSNEAYIPLYGDTKRYLVLKGGGGSGKSIFCGQKLLHRIVTEEGHRALVLRKVARTLRESSWQQIRMQISEYYNSADFAVNKSDMSITYKPNGNMILFSGLDKQHCSV